MAKINFLIPVVCTDSARVEQEIPGELLPKFRKFLTENPQISWSTLEQFLADNDLQSDTKGIDINDRISEACSEFDKDSLYWESSDYGAVDIENQDFTAFDNTGDWLLRALSEIRELGSTNMLDKSAVATLCHQLGYEEESAIITDMKRDEYIQLVTVELPQWIEIEV